MLDGIEEPINLYLFFSDEATDDAAEPARVCRPASARCSRSSRRNAPDGKLVLNVVDPLPFSEDEDRAEQFGLQAANVGTGGEAVYFGLAGSNSVGTIDRIPFFQPDPRKEAFLEYDLARLVYNLANTDKTVVGLLTSAPIGGGFDPQTQQPSQPWVVVEQAKQLLEVRTLPASVLDDRRRRRRALDRASRDARRRHALRDRSVRHARRPRADLRRPARRDPRRRRPDGPRDRRRRGRPRRSTGCSARGASLQHDERRHRQSLRR